MCFITHQEEPMDCSIIRPSQPGITDQGEYSAAAKTNYPEDEVTGVVCQGKC